MSYILEAIVGATTVVRGMVDLQPSAVLVPLWRDLALVPMTDELFETITDGTDDRPLGFLKLPSGFDRALSAWSSAGPVGYVEAEFFGGAGSQRAALWTAGQLVFGPLSVDEGEAFASTGSPISQVLARLGVPRDGYVDEFEAVGLGRHRDTADWLP